VIDVARVSANIFEFAAPRVQSNLLARNGWKRERQEIIVADGKRGGAMARRWIEATESYALSASVFRHHASVSNCAADE
jgi:hypothetical protein